MGRQAEALSPYLARVGIVVLPEQWQAMADKKTAILMSVWFIGNTIRNNLLNTGAFEVSYEGTLIFSKLDTGRMPNMAELIDGVAQALAGGPTQ